MEPTNRSSDGFCPKANKEFSDEIIFLAPCPAEEGGTFASFNADGAENRKQLKAEEKMGDVIEGVIVAIDVAEFPAVAAKEEKQRIGEVGVLKPYGLKADLFSPGEEEDNFGDKGVISEGVKGLEKHEEK